jgi:hypothetical protein
LDEEQSTSGLLGSPSTDSDEGVNARLGNNNNNGDNKNLLMKNPLSRLPFAAPNLLPPLPPQFQIGNMMMAAQMNSQANKNPTMMPGQMSMEAMQHLFMQSPVFQHFQKQFLMSQQLFAQQQFLLQNQNAQTKSSSNGTVPKMNGTSPAQKRNKLSIDEILKQRVKPTNVVTETDDQPTDTSGSNGIGDDEEEEVKVKEELIKTEDQANCSQA